MHAPTAKRPIGFRTNAGGGSGVPQSAMAVLCAVVLVVVVLFTAGSASSFGLAQRAAAVAAGDDAPARRRKDDFPQAVEHDAAGAKAHATVAVAPNSDEVHPGVRNELINRGSAGPKSFRDSAAGLAVAKVREAHDEHVAKLRAASDAVKGEAKDDAAEEGGGATVALTAAAEDGENFEWAKRGITCPPYTIDDLDALQIPLKHLPRKKKTSVRQKYDRRAHNCAKDGIWNRVTIEDHHKILHHMARLGQIERGSVILDWGSGCGHSMQFLHDELNVTGVGIDVSVKTIEYAISNTTRRNLYCVDDGTKLQWLPSNTFDHVISFGSIYHVYNRVMFCHVLRQLVRVIRPGGTVYNGWTENGEYHRKHVAACFEDLPVEPKVLEERVEFADVKIFPLKARQDTPNTYSLVLKKTAAVPAAEEAAKFSLEGVPIECDEHYCARKSDAEEMAELEKRRSKAKK
jgi:ubiquinone/menaquinone biosynthesis C-methylase UbiE